jgi:hypothetical protein
LDSLFNTVDQQWAVMEPMIQGVATNGHLQKNEHGVSELVTLISAASSTTSAITQSWDYLGTTTQTTTLATLRILAPMPLSGSWAGGGTMSVGAKVAENLINQDQYLLKGFKLEHHIMDDKCDPTENSRLVLQRMARTTRMSLSVGRAARRLVPQRPSSLIR